MRQTTIADIYSTNAKIRERFLSTVSGISDSEAAALPDGEKWNIQQIVEHVSMVDTGSSRICAKLLDGAKKQGDPGDGNVTVSYIFDEKVKEVGGIKVEAPDRVAPTGSVSIAESLARIKSNVAVFNEMRRELELFDLSNPKFPHLFFGDMTAAEWLMVTGGHELRHTKQIERLLEKIRN